jgi:heme-degrading monooxygenase HmoA
MVNIAKDNKVFTVIVNFSVEPSKQQKLVEDIVDNLETVVKKYSGFVSSSIHKSLDGTRVVNYVQWETREDFEAYLKDSPRFSTDTLKGPPEMNFYEVEYQSA